MSAKYYRRRTVNQIMPAPGWKVLTCSINDGQALFTEETVVGWGAVFVEYVKDGEAYDRETEQLLTIRETAPGQRTGVIGFR